MCFLTFEDRSGTVEVLIFPTLYPEARPFLESGEPFLLEGTVSLKEEETPKVLADRIVGVRELDSLPERRQIQFGGGSSNPGGFAPFENLSRRRRGSVLFL